MLTGDLRQTPGLFFFSQIFLIYSLDYSGSALFKWEFSFSDGKPDIPDPSQLWELSVPPPPSTGRKVNCSGAQWTASCVHQSWTHGIIWFGERMDINIRSRSLTPLPWWGQDKAFIPNLRVQLQLWQVLIYISSKLLRDPHLYFLCSLSFLE